MDDLPYIRFNDGACDSKGRFFAGTVYSKQHGIPGKLYKYDPEEGCTVVDEGPFTVSTLLISLSIWYDAAQDSNGLGWSPDEKTLLVLLSNNQTYLQRKLVISRIL